MDNTIQATFEEIISGEKSSLRSNSSTAFFKRIECKKGDLSIQASHFHYSLPRDNIGPYTHVEVGFPKPLPSGWEEWDDGYSDKGGGKVYYYVPVEKVKEFIDFLGGEVGIKNNKDNKDNINNKEKYCICGGPEKEYVGFNSRIMICSICGKDKKC